VNLELMGIENEVTEPIVLVDFGGDYNRALVTELAAEFDVVEGERIVRGFCPVDAVVSSILKDLLEPRGNTPSWEDISVCSHVCKATGDFALTESLLHSKDA
jgi:hypothetical protein